MWRPPCWINVFNEIECHVIGAKKGWPWIVVGYSSHTAVELVDTLATVAALMVKNICPHKV